MSLIGVLRWMVEMGRVDICVEVSLMSSQMALPRRGHLERLFNIFRYLKVHHNSEMVFDPSDPVIYKALFDITVVLPKKVAVQKCSWSMQGCLRIVMPCCIGIPVVSTQLVTVAH